MSAKNVFISYAHSSEAHRQRIQRLADEMRKAGLTVLVDTDVTTPQGPVEGWPKWMKHQIEEANWILVFFDEVYKRRYDGKEMPGKGLGATWEGAILTNQLYREATRNTRFIPLLADGDSSALIPDELFGANRYSIPMQTRALIEAILRTTTAAPASPALDQMLIPSSPSPSRLRTIADKLFGREEELALLDQAWRDPHTHIVTFIAWGGVGKTALISHWAAKQAQRGYNGASYFDWSFYSQGSRDVSAASADIFIKEALVFFDDEEMANSPVSAWNKGARLAKLVASHKTLLILDGMEPLQHPPGPMAGQLKDPALTALLKGLAQSNSGLCVVTTREQIADLNSFNQTTVKQVELQHLSVAAGVALLQQLGVKGTKAQLQATVERVDGYALTLTLLGSYLRDAYAGDIRKRDLLELEEADAEEQGGHAFRVMEAYERTFEREGDKGKRALAILRLLGLFDRPMTADCFVVLRQNPAIPGLTEPFVDLTEAQQNIAMSRLEAARLLTVNRDKAGALVSVDVHPLLRAYFAKKLSEGNPKAWKAAHKRLYEHLCTSTPYKDAPTLEELQPLYQAVSHGCQAGLQQEACAKVYHDRILKGTGHGGYYSFKKLGAISADLGAVACFFDQPWIRLSTKLSKPDQAWLLNEVATRLRALGRLREAVEPIQVAIELEVERKSWIDVSIGYSNLSELELILGQCEAAIRDGRRAVKFADESGDAVQLMLRSTTLADSLTQAGDVEEALVLFRQAEAMQQERLPEYPLLYALSGFRYCDLLLTRAERLAWQASCQTDSSQIAEVILACQDVERRTLQTLEWTRTARLSFLTIALDHLTLGRAGLYLSLFDSARSGNRSSAAVYLSQAVDGLRSAGDQSILPRGLLTRAWLQAGAGDLLAAQTDLDEVQQITEQGAMGLHLADVHLHRARLFRDRVALEKAKELIEKFGYHRRDQELKDAEAFFP